MPGLWDRLKLTGQTALITGSSQGLGFQMASALAEAGANLILVARNAELLLEAQQSLQEFRTEVHIIVGDVSEPAQAKEVCQKALALGQPIDILINNVGGRRHDIGIEDYTIELWLELLNLNLTSAMVMCQDIGKMMLDRRTGNIINITSIAGPIAIQGIRGKHYETAKSALAALTRSLAAEWADRGVRVNAIAPGVFETAPNRKWFAEKPEFRQKFLDHIPMGRLGQPEEIGPLAVFLASNASSYITGATFVIDGGFTVW